MLERSPLLKLKAKRVEHGLSVQDVAKALDCDINIIYTIESGVRQIKVGELKSLADAYKCETLEEFIECCLPE